MDVVVYHVKGLASVVMLTPAGFSSLQLCRNCAKFRKTVVYVMFRLITDAEVPLFCETTLQKNKGGIYSDNSA
mgnify:CR=1 FL=1